MTEEEQLQYAKIVVATSNLSNEVATFMLLKHPHSSSTEKLKMHNRWLNLKDELLEIVKPYLQ